MHDVSRDSLYRKQWEQKKHDIDPHHLHVDDQEYPHEHHDTALTDEGHGHSHYQHHYHGHSQDEHDHSHDHHDDEAHHHHPHKHVFYHSHLHAHDRVRRTLMHRVFRDPVRDWFGLSVVLLFGGIGFSGILPDKASQGLFLAAALIGLFPAMKNVIRISLLQKKMTLELLVVALLLVLIFSGHFFEAAIASLFLLLGSFLNLNFSWDED